MFENAWQKVQALVKIVFSVEVVLCVIVGIVILLSEGNTLYGILVIPIGIGASWLSYIV